jgi:hypothetical protein
MSAIFVDSEVLPLSKEFIYERCGEVKAADGEAGRGVYAYFAGDKEMRGYYSSNGEPIYLIKALGEVINLRTQKARDGILLEAQKQSIKANYGNYYKQPFAVQAYMMKNHPDAAGFVVPHIGPGLPTSLQAVLREDKIEFDLTGG